MVFYIYPTSLTPPLASPVELAPDPTSEPSSNLVITPQSTVTLTGADIAALKGLADEIHIYIAMQSTTPIALEKQPALAIQVGTGTPQTITAGTDLTTSVYDLPGLDSSHYVADVSWRSPKDNIYRFLINVYEVSDSWKIKIKNRDTVPHKFIWVIASSESEAQQPWIDVAPTLNFNVTVNQQSTQALTIANYGTKILEVTGTNPKLDSNLFTLSLPLTLQPNTSKPFDIKLTAPSTPPLPDGKINTTITFSTSDTNATTTAGHNNQVAITAQVNDPPNLIAAKHLKDSSNALIRGAAQSILIGSSLTAPGGNAYTTRKIAACMRDFEFFLNAIIEACRQKDDPASLNRTMVGLRETVTSLGIPPSPYRKFFQYVKANHNLTGEPANVANIYLDLAIQKLA